MSNVILDYSISWEYIVAMMEKKYGLCPDSDKLYSMSEIERMVDGIWRDFCDVKDEEYGFCK